MGPGNLLQASRSSPKHGEPPTLAAKNAPTFDVFRSAMLLVGLSFVAMLILCTLRDARLSRGIATWIPIAIIGYYAWEGRLSLAPLRAIMWPLIAVVLALVASSIFSMDPLYSFREMGNQHFWFALILASVALWATTPARQMLFLRGLMAAGAFAAITGIVLYYYLPWFVERGLEKPYRYLYVAHDASGNVYHRAQGMLGSYTRSAMFHTFTIPAALALTIIGLRERRFWEVALAIIIALFCAWYLLLTKSRGAWIGAALASGLTFLFLRGRLLIPIVGASLLAVVVLAMPSERARMATLARHLSQPDLLLSGRLDLWRQGILPVRENLFFGVGYGQDIFQRKSVKERYPLLKADAHMLEESERHQPDLHHLYFQTLAEVGIVGCLAYLYLLITLLVIGCRAIRDQWSRQTLPGTVVAFSCFISFLVIGFVYAMNENHIAHVAWATTGMLAASIGAGTPEKRTA